MKYKYVITSLDPPLEHMNTDRKHGYEDGKSDVLMTGNNNTTVFWDGMPCNLRKWYQSFCETCSFHLRSGNLQDYTLSHSTRS